MGPRLGPRTAMELEMHSIIRERALAGLGQARPGQPRGEPSSEPSLVVWSVLVACSSSMTAS